MVCLKCGRNLEEGQAFCATCLEKMHAYPVKPGTPIQLPPQQNSLPVKSRRKKQREPKPEEEIHRLRSAIRWLILILIVLFLAFGLMCTLLLVLLQRQELTLPL